MSKDKHFYYNQLTEAEKEAVDEAYTVYSDFMYEERGMYLSGDDVAEEVVNSMAKHVIENRGVSF